MSGASVVGRIAMTTDCCRAMMRGATSVRGLITHETELAHPMSHDDRLSELDRLTH